MCRIVKRWRLRPLCAACRTEVTEAAANQTIPRRLVLLFFSGLLEKLAVIDYERQITRPLLRVRAHPRIPGRDLAGSTPPDPLDSALHSSLLDPGTFSLNLFEFKMLPMSPPRRNGPKHYVVALGEPNVSPNLSPCSLLAAALRPQVRKYQGGGAFRFSLFLCPVPLGVPTARHFQATR